MESRSGNLVTSGIEPVDELLGGLERGQLYLVHGEASGKSLFGIKFLIEGLKQGENGALVIRYSPEDAVRRFARLGYDCLEDVYSGRLVILEYSDDIIQKIGRLRELTPVLRELEWLLGETRPERLIFDPVASVLTGAEGALETRALEFAEWARSFGATVVLIDNGANSEMIKNFLPLVVESFRFDVRGAGERAARFMAFEKSPAIPDQTIEVDPARGVFLLGRSYAPEGAETPQAAPHPPSIADLESIREELRSVRDRMRKEEFEPLADIDLMSEVLAEVDRTLRAPDTAGPALESEGRDALRTQKLPPLEEREFQAQRADVESEPAELSIEELELPLEEPLELSAPAIERGEVQIDELSDLLDDLIGAASPLDLDLPELETVGPQRREEVTGTAVAEGERPGFPFRQAEAPRARSAASARPRPPRHGRAADLRIDSARTARAVDLLLHPPEVSAELPLPPSQPGPPSEIRETAPLEPLGDVEAQPKDFKVLIIEDDAETCELVTRTLDDYTLEVVHDGVSGLAKLIAFKPDLVLLDFDLPIIDGFKVLTLIRSALNVPIIIVSGLRMRAIDRVMASELGADYYLTKPFSAKELKHKARQLIARYRGISSWIVNPPSTSRAQQSARGSEPAATVASERETFTSYSDFAAEVEKRVKATMESGAPFSIVGCRLTQMTADGGRLALRLYEIVRALARETDITSTNPRNDFVVLLHDADASGARAFAGRLRERVIQELTQEPSLWISSFPDLEESTEATAPVRRPADGDRPRRRSSDKAEKAQDNAEPARSPAYENHARRSDPRESYIDFRERL